MVGFRLLMKDPSVPKKRENKAPSQEKKKINNNKPTGAVIYIRFLSIEAMAYYLSEKAFNFFLYAKWERQSISTQIKKIVFLAK